MSDTIDDSASKLSNAAHIVYDRLKDYFWTEGGFLQGVGQGSDNGHPAVIVYLARRVGGHQEHLIPDEVDGIPVVTKFIGKVKIGPP